VPLLNQETDTPARRHARTLVEAVATIHPEFGAGQPVEVRIGLSMRDLLAKEEAEHGVVVGSRYAELDDLAVSFITIDLPWARHRSASVASPTS
jgi:hypothetical protein